MKMQSRALVIGSSLAGLWTARVLSDHFAQVTVLERDQLPDGLARERVCRQKTYPKIVEPAWLLATSADMEWLGNDKASTLPERVSGWYLPKVLDALLHDTEVHKAFVKVQNLMEPPAALFHPKIALRVMRSSMRPA